MFDCSPWLDEVGGDNAREFISMASNVLNQKMPTPLSFTAPKDLRQQGGLQILIRGKYQSDDIDTYFIPDDRGWRYTIERLTWLRKRARHQRNLSQGIVKIEFAKEDLCHFQVKLHFYYELLLRKCQVL